MIVFCQKEFFGGIIERWGFSLNLCETSVRQRKESLNFERFNSLVLSKGHPYPSFYRSSRFWFARGIFSQPYR